jgi:hypothetical protein
MFNLSKYTIPLIKLLAIHINIEMLQEHVAKNIRITTLFKQWQAWQNKKSWHINHYEFLFSKKALIGILQIKHHHFIRKSFSIPN